MATLTCSSSPSISLPTTMKTASVPVFAASGRRGCSSLPESRGLRIVRPLKSSFPLASSRNPMGCRQRGGIVCEAQDTAVDSIPAVTEATWDSLVLKSDVPVFVDFWAPWCGPCRMIDPVVSEIAKQYAGKVSCYKLNTDESPSIATTYAVRSIPTIMIFVAGDKKEAIIGAVPKSTLTASIEKYL